MRAKAERPRAEAPLVALAAGAEPEAELDPEECEAELGAVWLDEGAEPEPVPELEPEAAVGLETAVESEMADEGAAELDADVVAAEEDVCSVEEAADVCDVAGKEVWVRVTPTAAHSSREASSAFWISSPWHEVWMHSVVLATKFSSLHRHSLLEPQVPVGAFWMQLKAQVGKEGPWREERTEAETAETAAKVVKMAVKRMMNWVVTGWVS